MPVVCSIISDLHAHGPELSQLAPWADPELPIDNEAALPWDMAAGCPVTVTPSTFPVLMPSVEHVHLGEGLLI